MIYSLLLRVSLEIFSIIPIIVYPLFWPFFYLISSSKYLSDRYYGHVLRFVHCWARKPIHDMKQDLFKDISKARSSFPDLQAKNAIRVLEIGPGLGYNFQFYPPKTLLTTIEINDYLEKHFESIQSKYPNITLERSIVGNAEDMNQIPDNSFDAVVATLLLCCADNPLAVVKEIHRVLVPGGQYYVLEGIFDTPGTLKYKLQKVYEPIFKAVSTRCRLGGFDSVNEIRKVGFDVSALKWHHMKEAPTIINHAVYGIAIKK